MTKELELGLAPETLTALNKALKALKVFAARHPHHNSALECALFHGENIDVADGHICVRLHVRGARFERSLVPIREVSDARASLAYRIKAVEEGGGFPSLGPLLQDLPTGGIRRSVTVNPELFARVAKLRKALPGEGVTFRFEGGQFDSIYFSFDSPKTGIEVEGLLMPMRV